MLSICCASFNLQDMQNKMMSQIGTLNQKTATLEADIQKLTSEKKALQQQLDQGKERPTYRLKIGCVCYIIVYYLVILDG